MCGIAGIIHLDGTPVERDVLVSMTRVQKHRGPDDEGIYLDSAAHIGLGHQRLSIIDLSSAGHQPMCYLGRYWIAYNGEVYNYIELRQELEQRGYSFTSQTDTEVILAAYACWGVECLQRFNGMWSLAIWDTVERQLFCARDRFGIKPFYYFWNHKRFVFATEIKAIVEYLRNTKTAEVVADDEVMSDYLLGLRLDSGEKTFFRGIHRLPPSHYLICQGEDVYQHRYYELDPARQWESANEHAGFDNFWELFSDAIRLRLRSDVPIGSCLSGGFDSSSIVCVANQLLFSNGKRNLAVVGQRQKTFSACYEGYAQYDEREYINAVLEQTAAEGHFVFPDPQQLFDELEKFVWHQDEPVGSTSQYAQWCVFRRAHEQGVKVMLDGQGADETISGYHGAYHTFFLELAQQGKWRKLKHEVQLYQQFHHHPALSTWVTLARGLLRASLSNGLHRQIVGRRLQHSHPLFSVRPSKLIEEDEQASRWQQRGALQKYLFNMVTGSSLQSLLRYEDRNSMAFSIEARVPFLDYRLVEFVFSLPGHFKVNEGLTKVLLRETMKGIIPEKVRNRIDKIGFATPEGQWFRTSGREYIRAIFSSRSFNERRYFNATAIRDAFDRLCDNSLSNISVYNYSQFWESINPIWRALNAELWCRIFLDSK